MEAIGASEAFRIAKEISQVPDWTFTIAFYPYSRAKGITSNQLTIKEGCTWRKQLPSDKFSIDADNYFLFTDGEGNPRMCYRVLVRFMIFPDTNKPTKLLHV